MCGLAGFVSNRDDQNFADLGSNLFALLHHRGPDGQGWLTFDKTFRQGTEINQPLTGRAVLLHKRLSILDLSDAGSQPMRSRDGRYAIVFNGEIYNYLELRTELESEGCQFSSHSDTEVLLNAYVVWGERCLTRLNGMFAFSVLDVKENVLFLARDFFGIKPLYYAKWQHGFCFASEIKAILAFPGIGRKCDPESLFYYLRYGLTDASERTLFADVNQLSPAHFLKVRLDDPNTLEIKRYWCLPRRKRPGSIQFSDAVIELKRLFVESIDLHLRSDVPVGAALSGGLDSTAIVCAAAPRYSRKGGFSTFSYIPAEARLSEEKWVDLAVGKVNARSHKVRIAPKEIIGQIEDLVYHQDEPVASSSVYAQYRIFEKASTAGIKVMLDGQGADELFGGYFDYFSNRLASLLASGRVVPAVHLFRSVLQRSELSFARLAAQTSMAMLPKGIRRVARKLGGAGDFNDWMNRDYFVRRGVNTEALESDKVITTLDDRLRSGLGHDSLPRLLRYEDRNSMRFSIESRVPFLTKDLAEFAFSLPEQFLISSKGDTKHVYRESVREILPPAIAQRRDKVGFITEELYWLKELRKWTAELLDSDAAHSIPALNVERIKLALDTLSNGGRYDWAGWRWINLILWSKVFKVEF